MTYSLRKAQYLADMAESRKSDDFILLAHVIRARNAKDGEFKAFLQSLKV